MHHRPNDLEWQNEYRNRIKDRGRFCVFALVLYSVSVKTENRPLSFIGADIIRPREADSLPYEFYRWVGAFNNEDKKDRGQKDRGTGL